MLSYSVGYRVKMREDLEASIQKLIELGIGDTGRLNHILNTIRKGSPLFSSDQKYLTTLLSSKPNTEIQETRTQDEKGNSVESLREEVRQLEKIQETQANKIDRLAIKSYKSEGTTTVLSLLGFIGILGVGHMYVSKTSKGVGLLIAGFIIMLIIVALAAAWSNISNCYECGIPVEEGFVVLGFLAGLVIAYLVLFIWQIFNARKLCREYNLDVHSIPSTKYSQNKTTVDFNYDEIKIKKKWSKTKTVVIVIACIFGLILLGPLLPQPHVAPPQNQYMPIGADSPYAQELKSKFSSCVDTLGNVSKCQQILSAQNIYAGQPLKQGPP